jgi:hypothetical protein
MKLIFYNIKLVDTWFILPFICLTRPNYLKEMIFSLEIGWYKYVATIELVGEKKNAN